MARNAASAACVASVACTGASVAGVASGSDAAIATASASAPWSRIRFKATAPGERPSMLPAAGARQPWRKSCLGSVRGAVAVPAAVADIQVQAVGGGEGGEQVLHDAHRVLLVRSEEHTSELQSLMR